MLMSGKTGMREKAKAIWIRGMKAVGNTAASIANNTRYKVDEVTIQNRRREVLSDLAHKAYALWLKGEPFPEQMEKLLSELKKLDEQLNDMRAEKYAVSGKASRPSDEEAESPDADEPQEEDAEPISVGEDSPVCAEINDLFDVTPSVGRTAEKVNSALDQMSERIRSFPQESKDADIKQRQD